MDGKLERLALARVLVEKQYLHFLLSWYLHNERAALFSDRAAARKGGIALDPGCELLLHHCGVGGPGASYLTCQSLGFFITP